ncbi:auxin-responsive protein SAUR78 [Lactuca sativa]|uniref:auxin-responsive protein SAUR78 n=1 Tax=Lactuca sativa TaxID=4236 RepID=UPI000CB41DC5|nr:auxin-responsive protein SAUR78 [Lactuca sativa]
MAKGGKLIKIKSVLKKWHSFGNGKPGGLTKGCFSASTSDEDIECPQQKLSRSHSHPAVYVGKSRRRYLISFGVAQHPLFQELVERSGSGLDDEDHPNVTIKCEVVLFEHLLWMIENAVSQPDALHELVDFYAC